MIITHDAPRLNDSSHLYPLKHSGLLKRAGKFLSTLYTSLVFISVVFDDGSGSALAPSSAKCSSMFPFAPGPSESERVVAINIVTKWRRVYLT